MLAWEYCKLKTSELVPHTQIGKSLDTSTQLKAAEPMVRTGFHPEGGQMERGEHISAIVRQTCLIKQNTNVRIHDELWSTSDYQ